MSIFSKRIDNLEFSDIDEFCKGQHPENLCLDYKQALSTQGDSKQISKLATAFANAHGGVMLLGVSESKATDGRGVPNDWTTGIDGSTNPVQKIKQICLDNISPPILPEVKGVPVPNNTNQVVVVARFGESDQSPHYIRTTGRAYIRMGDISHLAADEADSDASPTDIEWLLKRREKPAVLRENLIEFARGRVPRARGDLKKDTLECSVIPLYPRFPMFTLDQLASEFARLSEHYSDYRSANHSIFTREYSQETKNWKYFELNEFGMMYCAAPASEHTRSERSMNTLTLMDRLLCMCKHTIDLYSRIEYFGLVQIRVVLDGIWDFALVKSNYGSPMSSRNYAADNSVTLEAVLPVSELLDPTWLKDIHRRFLWALGDARLALQQNVVDQDYNDATKEYERQNIKSLIYTL